MRKPNTGMIDDILMKCKDTVMRGMNFSQLKGCSLMVGDASGLPGQFSDSDKVCAEKARVEESRYWCVRSGRRPADGEGAGDRPVPVRLRCVNSIVVAGKNEQEVSAFSFEAYVDKDFLENHKLTSIQ